VLCVESLFQSGLSTARQLAMLVYKSWDTFNTRFDWNPSFVSDKWSFQIESYLNHQGAKFSHSAASSYDPNCYMLLSKASDLTNLQFRGKEVSELRNLYVLVFSLCFQRQLVTQ
jgi:homoserine acetyltransferase